MLWLGVFFLLPLVQLAAVSLQSRYPGFPGYYYRDLNFSNYAAALTDYAPHFARSFLYAGLATFLAFVIAYPLAYAMAFKAGKWRNLMMICVIAPFFTSFILRTFAWSQILADEGWVAGTLNFLNLLPGGAIINTPVAVVAGLTYNFLPFMVLPIYASLERADPRVIEAGGDLYANGFTTFRTVTLPMSMPGVLAGTLLTFIPAAGDFVNMELLGPQRGKMVGNVINDQFLAIPGGYPVAASPPPPTDRPRPSGPSSGWPTTSRCSRRSWCCSTCSCRSPTPSPSPSTTTARPTSCGRASPGSTGRTRAACPGCAARW